MKFRELILIIFSSFLLVLIFPKFDFSFLSWVALVPFFYSLKGKRSLNAFYSGWLWGTLFFLGAIYWVINTMINYGHISVLLSLLILVIFSLYLGLFFGIFSCAISAIGLRLN